MTVSSGIRSWWDSVLDIGTYPGETDIHRGIRRIAVGYFVIGALARSIATVVEFGDGSIAAWVDLTASLASMVLLFVLWRKPHWFIGIVNVALFLALVEVLSATVLLGGLVPSEMVVLWGVIAVVGALIMLRIRDAFLWFLAYMVTLALSVALPNWIDAPEVFDWSPAGIATTVAGVTAFIFAGMAYFVRQRDRLQRESDDLLHSILPDEIARRLKTDTAMIADDYESVSILFADVVDFTPMSSKMTPAELVGLLNSLFTAFDAFVDQLGLEKIKTVGDAYMVASGVPDARSDHAHAIAELALLIRDHTTETMINGHSLNLRIGINSGSVVAGVVGTDKFAYDLWGDTVNTASRMESGGIPGAIQVTGATEALIRDAFLCEPRGVVRVKGKGDMNTYLLIGARTNSLQP
jgi:guanylate cyclase